MQRNLRNKTYKRHQSIAYAKQSLGQIKKIVNNNTGFIETMWCESNKCEGIPKETVEITFRCMPFKQEHLVDNFSIDTKQ